jgi:hypothetical protein
MVGIQQREGCTTVPAFGSHLEIDGGTALRAGNLPHLSSNPLNFRRCQATNELFLAQELKERCHAVKPNAGASKAQVHIHCAVIVSLQRLSLHGRAAAGTGNGVGTAIGHICNWGTKTDAA